MTKPESKEARRKRLSKAGKASAAKRGKKYYEKFSVLGNKAQGMGKGSRTNVAN